MRIDAYEFGSIEIDGERYTSDVIIYPDHVDTSWWRREGHGLCPEDLGEAVKASPDLLIVGTGAHGVMRVPEATRQWVEEQGIELIAMDTKAACDEFNRQADSRRTVAGLHLTC